MTRLLSLLLTVLSINLQGQVFTAGDTTYYPRSNEYLTTIYRQVGYSVVAPKSLDKTKKYPVWLVIHGVGERGQGRLDDLRNVLLGYDYDGAGPRGREPAVVYPDLLKAVNQEQFLLVAVNYGGEFNPGDINFVLDEVEKNWPVDVSREALLGFSLGGGAVVRYITSSLANAYRVALAVSVAPVNWATNYSYIRDATLPVIGVTNQSDPTVSPNNIKTIVSSINALSPSIPAQLVTFAQSGHGGFREIQSLSYSPQTIYSYLNSITKDSPKAYPTTSTKPPVVEPPATTLPVLKFTAPDITSTPSFKLQGCPSTDWDSFKWGVLSVPKGANVYSPFVTSGAGWCEANVTLTVEGAYSFFAQACKGASCVRDTFVVTYQKTTIPVPRNPVSFETITGLLLFSDGTTEKATAMVNFTTKKVTVKTEDGKEYTW